SPHLAHEKTGESAQDLVSGLVAVAVVVLLEMVHINEDAAPRPRQALAGNFKHRKITAIETSGEGIANALLTKLVFQLFVNGDIHQNAVVEGLAGFRFRERISRIEDSAGSAVSPPDFQLEFADVAIALKDPLLPVTNFCVGKISDLMLAQFFDRGHAQDIEQRLIGIDESTLRAGDVNSLLQVLHQLAQNLRITQASHA